MSNDLILAVCGLAVLAAALLCFACRRTRPLGLAVVVLLFAGIGAWSLFAPEAAVLAPASRPAETLPEAGTTAGTPSVWSDGMARGFEADVYATAGEAVEALASRVAESACLVSGDLDGPSRLVVLHTSRLDLASDFEGALSRLMPSTRVSRGAVADGGGANTVELTFSAAIARGPAAGGDAEEGACEARLRLGDADKLHRVNCAGKPWVSDFSDYTDAHPDATLICVRSCNACTSAEEAHAEAVNAAAARIDALLKEEPGRHDGALDPVSSRDVERHFGIVDRFAQCFEGVAGSIWREALLVGVSPAKIASYAAKQRGASRIHPDTWWHRMVRVVGVLVAIALLHLLIHKMALVYDRNQPG